MQSLPRLRLVGVLRENRLETGTAWECEKQQQTNERLVTGVLIARERGQEEQIVMQETDSVTRLQEDDLRVARPSLLKLRLAVKGAQRCWAFAAPAPNGVHVQET